ncbi:MAG: 4Fe-4S binding protein, partial [Alphaproteobacteria bacterium]|nr:4Fe-4S binding protein [Alphaproteobacteria bacterium]
DMVFADLAAALATPALIGRNLLGETEHDAAMANSAEGDSLLLVATAGRAGLRQGGGALAGTAAASALRLRQGAVTLPLQDLHMQPLAGLAAAGAPAFAEMALVRIPAESGFDGARPWLLEIAFDGAARFAVPYALPAELVIEATPRMVAAADNRIAEVPPLWLSVWHDQRAKIAVLVAALTALSAVLLAQTRLVRNPRWLPWLRGGFLAFSLVWIGWYAGAQLSIAHLITLVRAPFQGGGLEALLLDPVTMILLSFAGLALLLLGRGIFCGWLCPFGALQELLNKAARRLGVRQRRVPTALNERLWALKYVAAMALVALVFIDQPRVARAVEIEPFNTAIMLGFVRAWPYVAFALVILAVGLFVERAYCRYLCPLGGGLAILGRWRMLLWLKRRPECGRSCNTCQPLCPVQAIGDDGSINLNECYHCLACQVAYQDDHICPPLVARRERLERLEAKPDIAPAKAAEPVVAE